jgi:gliding motility-associated-like protein
MRLIGLLYIVFLFSSTSLLGQKSYSKTILNETYNGYSQSGSLTTCLDTSLAVFSFIPVKGNNAFKSTELIALKHDSLGQLYSKQYLKFPQPYTLFSCKWYHNKVFVLLSSSVQTGSGSSGSSIVILRFSNNLILEKSVIFSSFEMETNNPSVLAEAPDSTLLFSGRVKSPLNGGPGDQFLAQIDFDLDVIQSVELAQQFKYSIPGYSNGNYYWYTYEGRYTLDANFNTHGNDSLVDTENTKPSVEAFNVGTQGLNLKIIDNIPSENYSRVVSFSHNHVQQKILLSTEQYLLNSNNSTDNSQYFAPYLNANDSLRLDIFQLVEDSGHVLKQTISLQDTAYINAKPHIQAYGHYLVEHILSADTSINFLKGVDSIPAASCLNISYPVDTLIDTNNVMYSFVPRIGVVPSLTKNIPFSTYNYSIQTLDSLNATGDTTLPAFEYKCINKSCGVFSPPNGGLQCNKKQVLLQIHRENPFGLDTNQFITRIVWNDTFEQDSYLVKGPKAQTVKIFGENIFCEQTAYISFDFDSIRATSTHQGDICLDFPTEATIQVTGLFTSIEWQNPEFSPTTFQTVYLPGNYPFTVHSLKGCQLNLNAIVPEICPPKVYIPNAFTPNGDGTNDAFVGYADFTNEFIFRIYDRWGQVIFSTTTSPIIWDGTYKGESVQIGVYNWRLVYNSIYQGDLYIKDLFGHITVVR